MEPAAHTSGPATGDRQGPTVEDLLAALPRRIADLPEQWARETPEAVALTDPDGVLTYAGFQAAIREAADRLAAAGVRPGDRVMIVNENGRAAAALIFAAGRLDAWPVIVNARLSAREIDVIRDHCAARRIVYTAAASAEAAAHAERHGAAPAEIGALPGVAMAPLAEAEPEPVHDDPARQVAALMYTSGTTGAPKGVMVSHQAALFVASSPGSQRRVGRHDVVYCALPVSHIYGLTSTLLRTVYGGGHVVLVPRFDPRHLADALESGGVTVLQGVPQMYARLLEYAKEAGRPLAAPDLEFATIGGAHVEPELKAAGERALGLRLVVGYGMTEFASTVTRSLPEHVGRDNTAGPPLPGIEARAAGPDGAALPVGEVGEIWLRGPNRMLGYYRDPEATRAVVTPDGWYRTGDLGRLDERGNIVFVERAREIIIRSGFNVHPVEVEEVLASHPDVTLAAVVGRSVPGNEEIVAFVQPMPGAAVSADALAAYAAERLAPYKRPAEIRILDALPAAATGKILKARLRQMV